LEEEIVNRNKDLQGFYVGFAIDGFKRVIWLSIYLLFTLLIFGFMFCNFDYDFVLALDLCKY